MNLSLTSLILFLISWIALFVGNAWAYSVIPGPFPIIGMMAASVLSGYYTYKIFKKLRSNL